MRRKGRSDIFAEAALRGAYDEFPILPAGIEPQLHVSRGSEPQPFWLVCEQDTLLAQFAGEARIEFADASVNWFDLVVGDFVYIPGGTSHRLIPRGEVIQVRYKPDNPGLEAVEWRSSSTGKRIAHLVFDCAGELPQEAYLRAVTKFNADPVMRRCPDTGAMLEPIDLSRYRWRQTAAEIRSALAEEGVVAPSSERVSGRSVFAAAPMRTELVRVNVYEFVRCATTALNPMFPWLGAGCMVPCTALHDARQGGPMGYFLHENTVHEVNVCFGARSNFRKAGAVFVGPKHHGVGQKPEPQHVHGVGQKPGAPDREDMVAISVITQRQSVDQPQREAMTLVCEQCEAELLRHPYDAHEVPEAISAAWSKDILGLPTLSHDAFVVERFNNDPTLRTCHKCGHLSGLFPVGYWGWDKYRHRTKVIVLARNLMADAGTRALRGETHETAPSVAVANCQAPADAVVREATRWIDAGSPDDLAIGAMAERTIEGSILTLYRLADGYWATDGICTHAFAQLALGYFEEDAVECPFHGGRFDVRTGRALTEPCRVALKTYPVRLEAGRLLVGMSGAVA